MENTDELLEQFITRDFVKEVRVAKDPGEKAVDLANEINDMLDKVSVATTTLKANLPVSFDPLLLDPLVELLRWGTPPRRWPCPHPFLLKRERLERLENVIHSEVGNLVQGRVTQQLRAEIRNQVQEQVKDQIATQVADLIRDQIAIQVGEQTAQAVESPVRPIPVGKAVELLERFKRRDVVKEVKGALDPAGALVDIANEIHGVLTKPKVDLRTPDLRTPETKDWFRRVYLGEWGGDMGDGGGWVPHIPSWVHGIHPDWVIQFATIRREVEKLVQRQLAQQIREEIQSVVREQVRDSSLNQVKDLVKDQIAVQVREQIGQTGVVLEKPISKTTQS